MLEDHTAGSWHVSVLLSWLDTLTSWYERNSLKLKNIQKSERRCWWCNSSIKFIFWLLQSDAGSGPGDRRTCHHMFAGKTGATERKRAVQPLDAPGGSATLTQHQSRGARGGRGYTHTLSLTLPCFQLLQCHLHQPRYVTTTLSLCTHKHKWQVCMLIEGYLLEYRTAPYL